MSPVSPWRTSPGVWEKVSQMEGPRPSSFTAPSIWYEAVAVPHRNPSGNRTIFSSLSVSLTGGAGSLALRRILRELHQLYRVAVRVFYPRLPVIIQPDHRLPVQGHTLRPEMFADGVYIVCQEADVHEALYAVGGGGRTPGEHLDEAVARDVQVDEHEGAVVVVQPEGLADAEQSVEFERLLYVVGREGGMPQVGDHRSSLPPSAIHPKLGK